MYKTKQLLKLFIPPIFYIIKDYFLLRSLKKCFCSTVHLHCKKTNSIFILGNGPSLKIQLEKYNLQLSEQICMCVNSFVLTDYYVKVKPKIYLLVDPAYFVSIVAQETKREIDSVWNALLNKTSWPIELIVPSQYKDSECLSRLKKNSNINQLFLNQSDCVKYYSKNKQFELFNENKISPPAQTVINTAIYLGIFWRYKNIVLIGADTSWHKQLEVDQKTNEVYTEDSHFYGKKKVVLYLDDKRTIPVKIYEELINIVRAFEMYWLLKEYANYNSVTVFNSSEQSYIDAFERKSLREFI